MSRHMSEEEFLIMKQCTNPPPNTFNDDMDKADEGPESELAHKIRAYAKQKGYPCLIFPQSKKLSWFIPEGYVDVVLSIPRGITLYLELKAAKGVRGDNQKLMAAMLLQLGHKYNKIKSFKAFLQIIAKNDKLEDGDKL